MTDEALLRQIDDQEQTRLAADIETVELLKSVGQIVFQIAANEVAYELASQANLTDSPVDLTDLAEEIAVRRDELNASVESAIIERKRSLFADHQQKILRELLLRSFG